MSLCNDCRDIRLASYIKGMQKRDKRMLMRRNRDFYQCPLYRSPRYRSDVAKDALAVFGWKAWSMNAEDFVRRDVEDSVMGPTGVYPFFVTHPLVLANLGSRLQRLPPKNCAFCILLSNIRSPPRRRVPKSEDFLVAFQYFKSPFGFERWDYDGTTSDVVMIAVISREQWATESLESFQRNMDDHKRVGFRFLTCRLEDCKSDVSQSLPVSRSTINFDQISQAIWDCRQNHRGCRAKRTASPQPIEISLIDCYTREVIQTTSLKRYVALSYVWGGVSAGDLNSTTLPPTLPRTLPRTLEDAIQVTKALGFTYIWFDQFCVNQCDHAIKHRQLRTMGRVYEDAMVTLVAASGPDANAGLPGAPRHPRKEFLHSVVIDGCIISEEAMPIDLEIQKSDWARRGWTFQEQFFSRKYVVFSANQVSFECRKTKYSSRFGMYDPAKSLLPDLKHLYSRLHERIEGDSLRVRERTLGKYQCLVKAYWPRRLTFQEDGINAFAGALEYLKVLWNAEFVQDARPLGSHESKMTFTAGIPHLLETEGMPLLLEYEEGLLDEGMRLFVQGLAWYSEHSSKRRKFFPSWCWAG